MNDASKFDYDLSFESGYEARLRQQKDVRISNLAEDITREVNGEEWNLLIFLDMVHREGFTPFGALVTFRL